MTAFFTTTLAQLSTHRPDSILGALTEALTKREGFSVNRETAESWLDGIKQLTTALSPLPSRVPTAATWTLFLEYVIPMTGKRIDAVLLAGDVIAVIEFKSGTTTSGPAALRQAQGYAINLADFHEESRGATVVPIALGTFKVPQPLDRLNPGRGAILASADLAVSVENAYETWSKKRSPIDAERWDHSRYFPVPTIIDAASAIYAGNGIKELARSRSGTENLVETQNCLVAEVQEAIASGTKKLIVVTGVPGAGKTLAGLNAVQAILPMLDKEREQASFLSGNAPLVAVLQAALRRSAKRLGKRTTRAIGTRVRDVHRFVKDGYSGTSPPSDNLVIFDEAQRAWTASKNKKKFGRNVSEPEMILEIMERHKRWAIIVALVGGGQEIHAGEAGLAAWGEAIAKRPGWTLVTSPEALHGGASVAGSRLFHSEPFPDVKIVERAALHLAISKRSLDCEVTAAWVNAVLNSDPKQAAKLAQKGLPIWVTRDLLALRRRLRAESAAGRRAGLIASSGAVRLRAEGVETPTFTFLGGIDYRRWFLEDGADFRSSNQLEIALSEFEMQGLEIDFAGLLWGGDLVLEAGRLVTRSLKGIRWEPHSGVGDPQRAADDLRTRCLNRYRVLLTRFRKGLVIFVPKGEAVDPTRKPSEFDGVYNYLMTCGTRELT